MTEPDTVTEPVNEDDELCTDCGVRLGDHCGECMDCKNLLESHCGDCDDCGCDGDHEGDCSNCGEPQCEGWCDDCDEYACDGCTCNEWEN